MTAVSAHTSSVIPLLKIITHPPKNQKSVKSFHSGFAFLPILKIYCWQLEGKGTDENLCHQNDNVMEHQVLPL